MPQATVVQAGDTIDYTAGAAFSSGDVVVRGELVTVIATDLVNGELGATYVSGVVTIAKQGGASVTFADGAAVYWDDTNNRAAATSNSGANTLMGWAVGAAVDAATSVTVLLGR
jgi:predicted RecA/RadA family phage recombinase